MTLTPPVGALDAPARGALGRLTVGDLLQRVALRAPRALAPPAALAAACQALATLPAVSGLILEARLGGPSAVDVSLRFDEAHGELRALADPTWLPPTWQAAPGWSELQRAARRLLTAPPPGSPGLLWAEMDAPSRPGAAASGFVGVSPEHPPAQATGWALEALGRGTPEEARRLSEVLAALPASARLRFVGAMWGRQGAPTRVCVTLPGEALPEALASLGSPLRPAGRSALPDELGEVVLNVDPALPPGGKLGVELQPRPQGWPALLRHLEALGLCSAEEGEAAASWPGTSTLRRPGAPRGVAPRPSLRALDSLSGVLGWAEQRRLNHVKLALDDGEVCAAQLYLYAGFTRFLRNDPRARRET